MFTLINEDTIITRKYSFNNNNVKIKSDEYIKLKFNEFEDIIRFFSLKQLQEMRERNISLKVKSILTQRIREMILNNL
jgi:hypothetical protein